MGTGEAVPAEADLGRPAAQQPVCVWGAPPGHGAPSERDVPEGDFCFWQGVILMLVQLISRKILLKFCVLFKPMMETGQH